MIQNNLEEMSGNRYKKCKLHNSDYYKFLKQKIAVKTYIQHIYARYNFKSRIYPQGHQKNLSMEISAYLAQNVQRAMIMKENQYQKAEPQK